MPEQRDTTVTGLRDANPGDVGMELLGFGGLPKSQQKQQVSGPPRAGDFVLAVIGSKESYLVRVADVRNGKIQSVITPAIYRDLKAGKTNRGQQHGVNASIFKAIYTLPTGKTTALEKFVNRRMQGNPNASSIVWDNPDEARQQLYEVMSKPGTADTASSEANYGNCISRQELEAHVRALRSDHQKIVNHITNVRTKGEPPKATPGDVKQGVGVAGVKDKTEPEPMAAYSFESGKPSSSVAMPVYDFDPDAVMASTSPIPPYNFKSRETPSKTLIGEIARKVGQKVNREDNSWVRRDFQKRQHGKLGRGGGATTVNITTT